MAELRGYPQLQARLRAISGPVLGVEVLRQLGNATVREAKLLVPRKTSNLGRSIHVASVTQRTALVVASAKYAAYVEFGTRPHEITPRVRKALRWAASPAGRRLSGTPRTGASVVFAKSVHHPGTRAKPFLLPGARRAATKAGLPEKIVQLWNSAA